jgi:hypothetical protein
MREAIPPLPQYAFMAWCPVKAQGYLYIFLFYRRIKLYGRPGNPVGYVTENQVLNEA